MGCFSCSRRFCSFHTIIILNILGIVGLIVFYIGYWAVLITGKYPQGLFAFVVGVQRWSTRTDSWMYGMVDKYPPFSLSAMDYPARLEVDYPEASSRGLALLGVLFLIKLILLVPHLIILYALASSRSSSSTLPTGRYS